MKQNHHKVIVAIGLASLSFLALLFLIIILCCRKRKSENNYRDSESVQVGGAFLKDSDCFINFQDSDNGLTVQGILDAPGEVIGKSSYGTLYRASLVNLGSLALLRFLRPSCTLRVKDVLGIVAFFGSIKHPNLVPLTAFYAGPRGEMLMVHPFYGFGNLAQFIKDINNADALKWPVVHKISIGIARGLHHLHSSVGKPLVHGNLKSKNVLLDRHFNPYVSDFGLYLLLTPTAGQQMLEASVSDRCTAPEVMKMRDANEGSDIYSLGVIFLELFGGKTWANQEFGLPGSYILGDRITGFYHPDILLGLTGDQRVVTEDRVLKFFNLAMACCSPSPVVRPDICQVLETLEGIGD